MRGIALSGAGKQYEANRENNGLDYDGKPGIGFRT
jgi:hypothetical protein